MLMTPPAVCPYSAEKFEVWTVNSCTVSGENVTTARPRPTPVFRAPSARIDGVELRRRDAPLVRRREGERRSGPDVGDGHRRARHDGSAAIGDRARDPALVGLGDRDGAEEGSGNGGKRSASSHPCLRWSWSEAVFISLLFVRIIVCTHLKMGGQNPYLASRPVPRCGTLRQGAQWHSSLLP